MQFSDQMRSEYLIFFYYSQVRKRNFAFTLKNDQLLKVFRFHRIKIINNITVAPEINMNVSFFNRFIKVNKLY